MTKLITTNYKTHMGNQFLESLSEASNNVYYLFAGDHIDKSTGVVDTPPDDVREVSIDSFRNMQFGKRITPSDAKLMIRNIPYAANKTFTMYDDNDDDLYTQDYYCVVNEASYYHVYKCLDNNLGTNSTVQPDFSHITGSNTIVYQTSDGYRWKYMYSVDYGIYNKFATAEYIPVVANSTVTDAAITGALDIIKIDNEGKNYANFTNGAFATSDLRYGGDSTLYRISNNEVNQTNGYYTGCLLYLSSGTGVGQYKTITDYYVNPNGNFMVVNSAFNTPPLNGTIFEVNPQVMVTGSGSETTTAIARALVNTLSTNSIYRVEVLERGLNYEYFQANVVANDVVGVTDLAEVRPIYSPNEGHGKKVAEELGCKYYGIGMKFSNSEANTIPTFNDFHTIGIIKDPLFANVGVEIQNSNGSFVTGERVWKYNPVRINTNATVNTSSAIINCPTADFENQLTVGDYLYIQSGNSTSHQLTTVNSITNSSQIVVASNGYWACTETMIYQANVSTTSYIQGVTNTSFIYMSNVVYGFSTNDSFIGWNSGAKAQVNTTFRNDVNKGFESFIQMHKYTGTIISGTFQNDETVYQGPSLATSISNASLYVADINGGTTTFYLSNQVGTIVTSNNLVGNTSSAEASITNRYLPELVFGSAEVIYLENLEKVPRANDQTETFKLIFEL
jgi:hypothetical protein